MKNTPACTSQETLISFIISMEESLHGVPFLRRGKQREYAALLRCPGAIARAHRSLRELAFGGVIF